MKRLIEKMCLLGIGDGLPLGDLADEPLAVLGEGDDRRGGASALRVGDDDRIAALHDRDDRVGRSQVDADDLGSHVYSDRGLCVEVLAVSATSHGSTGE